jgi:hypothetical protein
MDAVGTSSRSTCRPFLAVSNRPEEQEVERSSVTPAPLTALASVFAQGRYVGAILLRGPKGFEALGDGAPCSEFSTHNAKPLRRCRRLACKLLRTAIFEGRNLRMTVVLESPHGEGERVAVFGSTKCSGVRKCFKTDGCLPNIIKRIFVFHIPCRELWSYGEPLGFPNWAQEKVERVRNRCLRVRIGGGQDGFFFR